MKRKTITILTLLAMLTLFIVFIAKGRPVSAFPGMEADCTKCHGAEGVYPNPVSATLEATLIAPGDAYQVTITMSNPVNGATGTGYWIANSDAVSVTGSSTGIFAGAAGQGTDGKWTATMIAPGLPGTYYYKVFGQSGKTGLSGSTGFATYNIEVSNDAPRSKNTPQQPTTSPALVNCGGACHGPRPWTDAPMPPRGANPDGPGSTNPGSPALVNCGGACHGPRPWTDAPMPPPGWKPKGPGTGNPGTTTPVPATPTPGGLVNCGGACHGPRPWTNVPMPPPPGWRPGMPYPLPAPTGPVTTPIPSVPPTGTVQPTVPPVTPTIPPVMPSPTPVITTPVPPINNGPGQQLFTTYCASCHASATSYGGLVTGATAISITTAIQQVPSMTYLQNTLQPQDVSNISSYLSPAATAKAMVASIPVTTTPKPSASPSPVASPPSASPGGEKGNPQPKPTPMPTVSPKAPPQPMPTPVLSPTPTPARPNGDQPKPTPSEREKERPKPSASPEREREDPRRGSSDSDEDTRNTKPSQRDKGKEDPQTSVPARGEGEKSKTESVPNRGEEDRSKSSAGEKVKTRLETKSSYSKADHQRGD